MNYKKMMMVTLCTVAINGNAENLEMLFPKETKEVKVVFGQTPSEQNEKVLKRTNYCTGDHPNKACGSIVFYKETNSFSYNFHSLERLVAATEYFIEKKNGQYKAYLDDIYDGKVVVDHVYEDNKNLSITFDKNGFPSIELIKLKLHGTTKFGMVSFYSDEEKIVLNGHIYDETDASFQKKVEDLTYQRMH